MQLFIGNATLSHEAKYATLGKALSHLLTFPKLVVHVVVY